MSDKIRALYAEDNRADQRRSKGTAFIEAVSTMSKISDDDCQDEAG